MGRVNAHGIRRRANGFGKKWRPSPNDPALEPPKKRAAKTVWKDDVKDVFKRA